MDIHRHRVHIKEKSGAIEKVVQQSGPVQRNLQKKIHDVGLELFGSFISGLEGDDERLRGYGNFAIDCKLDAANFSSLRRFRHKIIRGDEGGGRLLYTEGQYDANHVVF